jgi:16S rRNA (cytosine1402-N4)-methyltransferase
MRDEATPRQPPKGVPVRAAELPPARMRLVGRAARPAAAEVAGNPRARSAVMRVAERV